MFGKLNEENVLIQKQDYAEDGFIAIPDDVFCGMIYDEVEEEWSFPDIPLEELKERSLVQLTSNYNRASVDLLDVYKSEIERLTWNTQVFEANLVNPSGSPGSNDVPFFEGFIDANPDFAGPSSTDNENMALLKSVIESNNSAFAGAAGNLTGQLSKKRHDIIMSSDKAELEAVDITFIVPSISVEDKF